MSIFKSDPSIDDPNLSPELEQNKKNRRQIQKLKVGFVRMDLIDVA
jgi:hypothetical protein